MASHVQNDIAAGFLQEFKSFATDAIHVGSEPEQWNSMAVVPPISLSTTFKQHGPGKHAGFEYSRSGNPTRNCLEKAVAALDGAKYCLAVASGLAATLTITHLLKTGDGIVCMNDVYGGTNRYFRKIAGEVGLDVSFADCTTLELLKAALKPNTKMVWIETPTNPTMKVVDIQGCADIVHEHNKDTIVVVDNTFMSAYFQHELTKRQCTGCPGMITFYIKGNLEHASTFLSSLKLFALAESLGGYESLAEHPAIMTHASVCENERKKLGISDTLVRLSVGLEDEEDIIADLEQALSAAAPSWLRY
ncbi:Cystathionine gamma-lyase [Triplophysa tibetana]|uniref:Cystathionine gamma-lyase n=1 Tax=Triplophysa tibetana TaxID=1572043 RepID=A0A5A9NS76_9TELE|nr:Cystathionine gamma-lyase [Triplophysa tibetana]